MTIITNGEGGLSVRGRLNADIRKTTEYIARVEGLAKGREPATPRYFNLPAPADNVSVTALQMGLPPAMVWSNGTDWYNLGSGSALSPWWLPKGAVIHVDFENSRFYWDGAVKALSDLTDNGDGTYDLTFVSWWAGSASFLTEFEFDYGGTTPSGTIFSWTRSTSERVELDCSGSGQSNQPRLYIFPTGVNHNPQYVVDAIAGASYTAGRMRVMASVASGAAPILKAGNNPTVTSGTAAGTLNAPTKLTFGRRARFNDQVFTNGTLHKVTIWPRAMTSAEITELGKDAVKPPVHLLGDSFLNLHRVLGNLSIDLVGRGYIPVTQDGEGGTDLADQSTRYTSRPDYWGSTLVICDFGLSDTAEGAIAAFKSILANIKHDRVLYLEPAPVDDDGSANRIAFDAKLPIIQEFWGDRYVTTLDKAQALSTGSADDLAELAKNKWPLSIKTSIADFHPNETGYAAIAGWIYDELVARGWA